MSDESKKGLRCSFCGKHESQVHRMIQGPGVRICDECVQLCMSILNDGFEDTSSSALEDLPDQLPTPREIKDVLDQYVIGQDEAKVACPWRCTTTTNGSTSAGTRMWSCRRATS